MRFIFKIHESNISIRKFTINIIEESEIKRLKLKNQFKDDSRNWNGINSNWNTEYEMGTYDGFDTQFGMFFSNLLAKDGENHYNNKVVK